MAESSTRAQAVRVWIAQHHVALLAIAVVLVLALVGYAVYLHNRPPAVTVMTPAQVQDPAQVSKQLGVSTPVATQIVREIQTVTQKEPVVTYQVQAPTPQQAAQVVERQIKTDTTPVSLPPADKTIVTPQEQKVDVYRINLDKPRAVGVYVSSESAGAMAQYKNYVVFGGPKYNGGIEIGAAYLVRW